MTCDVLEDIVTDIGAYRDTLKRCDVQTFVAKPQRKTYKSTLDIMGSLSHAAV